MEPPGGGSLRAHRGTRPRPCHRRPGRRDRPLRRVGVTPGGRGHRLCPGAPGPARGVAVHSLRTGQHTAAPRRHRARARAGRPLTMPEAVIVATARTPIGRAFKGSLKDLRADDLAAFIIKAALEKVPQLDPEDIDDLMLGCGLPGGEQGFNMARVVAVLLGYDHLPGVTLTRYCSSSLQTTRMAFHAIKAGEGDVFISAGVAMGQTAENLALLKGIPRAEMDQFGVRSQNLAEKALANGFWAREITPVSLPDGTIVAKDDGPRPGVTIEAVTALRPVFRPHGRVTAGNCCPLNDGAAAVVIMSDTKARELGLTPLARIVATGVSALSPEIMGYGPVEASRRALARAGMTINDMDLVEINEAFAAQVIPSYRDLGIDINRLNVNGGAIALGHPFGMTGARITTTLINSLQFHDKQIGLETMCVGGGQGMALVLERLS